MNTRRWVLFGAMGAFLALGAAAQAAEDSVATLIGNLKSADKAVQLQAINELGGAAKRPPTRWPRWWNC